MSPRETDKLYKPRWGRLGFFVVFALFLESFTVTLLFASTLFAEDTSNKNAIILLKTSTIRQMTEAKETLKGKGIRVHHIFPNNVFFVGVPVSLKEEIASLPAVQEVAFGKLDPAKYPSHRLAIETWNKNYFGQRRRRAVSEPPESFGDTVLIAPDLPRSEEEKEEAERRYQEGFEQRRGELERKYNK